MNTTEDILAVQAVVARIAHTIDSKRWPELRALLACISHEV